MSLEVLCLGMSVTDVLVRGVSGIPAVGTTDFVGGIEFAAGGDALNQAITLANLGHTTGLATVLGADRAGDVVLEGCRDAGVDTRWIVRDPELHTTTTVVLVDPSGERSFLSARGGSAARYGRHHVDLHEFPAGLKVLSVGSLLTSEPLDREVLPGLLARARAAGIMTIADMVTDNAPDPDVLGPVLEHLDYFVPSEGEALHCTGSNDPRAAADALLAAGVGTVVVKRGTAGSLAVDRSGTVTQVSAFRVPEVVDTTGSGDNFIAGFISGLLRGEDLADALRRGAAVAAVSVQALGASAGVRKDPHGADHLLLSDRITT